MRIRSLVTILLISATPAFAAEKAAEKPAAHGAEKPEKESGAPGTNVDMPFLMAPMTDADGKLTGYAYITSRLTASSEAIVTDVREKLPFIQDVLLRDVNNSPVALPDNPQEVNIPGLEARLLAGARKVMGGAKIKTVTVCTVQIAELRPKQTPALHTPPEKSRCES